MKLILIGLLVAATQAQAQSFRCVNNSGQYVGNIGLFPDGGASFDSSTICAVGAYTGVFEIITSNFYDQIDGNWDANLSINRFSLKSPEYANVKAISAKLSKSADSVQGTIQFVQKDGSQSQPLKILCTPEDF